MTKAEYYAKIEALIPGCNPYDIDIELNRFYNQFRAEVQCHSTSSSLGCPQNLKPAVYVLDKYIIAPTWMFDPDELRDKLCHLRCHLTRTVHPDDDDSWARAARSAHGLAALLTHAYWAYK
ncbi:hypothetical protein CTheo_5243 [Ceratobasidium theobromae]|uniref:Uncharacterized protein n=1 Tax=Ceratobasidium theobromae TaxID=1582974 RepID=A0A5N5QJ54_9AGAM|nr:hypothetical protein CTheo_5243 [Ceratobasidium theobromae]